MVKEDINEKSGMNTKDRIDAFMSLANFYREVREARIRREWRVTFGLWVALATIAISAGSIKAIPYYFVVGFVLLAFVLYLPWLFFHFGVHERDTGRMYRYRDSAASLLIPDETPPQRPTNLVLWAQVFIAALLSGAAFGRKLVYSITNKISSHRQLSQLNPGRAYRSSGSIADRPRPQRQPWRCVSQQRQGPGSISQTRRRKE